MALMYLLSVFLKAPHYTSVKLLPCLENKYTDTEIINPQSVSWPHSITSKALRLKKGIGTIGFYYN